MKKTSEVSEKYFEALKKFNLTPDFKLSDREKEIVKYIDKAGNATLFELADAYDMRPSEVKELVGDLTEKGVVQSEGESVTLSEAAIRYIRAPKEARKTEKKFRKFLNTLNDQDIDRLLELVDSFEVRDPADKDENQ